MSYEAALERFVEAQEPVYARALEEIRRGEKRSHWMWFIFPQLAGLGSSAMAQRFAIASLGEAQAYLDHPLLGPRYIACVEALQDLGSSDPLPVFGHTDARKLQSSLTLFEAASGEPIITAALDRWFAGARDARTLDLLAAGAADIHSK